MKSYFDVFSTVVNIETKIYSVKFIYLGVIIYEKNIYTYSNL